MTLRQRLFDNCTLVRAQAALVALLYVFLCTFGTLTHTHTSPEAHETSSPLATAQSAHSLPGLNKRAGVEPVHCAFCDWQANNLARIVVPLRAVAPATILCRFVPLYVPVAVVLPTHSSSRAPPIV